jgi:hypothetical protein
MSLNHPHSSKSDARIAFESTTDRDKIVIHSGACGYPIEIPAEEAGEYARGALFVFWIALATVPFLWLALLSY